MIRTYSELSQIKSFEERYEYLKLGGTIGSATFGYDRYLNQMLYTSGRWKKTRDKIIIRDNGCDLGIDEYSIKFIIIIHHMNILTIEDIENERDEIFDPEFLICTSRNTHNAIHFGDKNLLPQLPITRTINDMRPWRI